MQSHARLRFDKVLKLRMAKNFISKNFRQAKYVFSIFASFLHHCALQCPALQELEAGSEVDLHVLECFQATIVTIVDTLLDPRSQVSAVAIIAKQSMKAEFLMSQLRPAILNTSVEVLPGKEALEAPLFLHAGSAALGTLMKADVSQ